MNLLIKLVTCIVVFDVVGPVSANVTCGLEGANVANPDDCNSFYSCAPGHHPILMQCHPSTLVFNPQLQICVYPDDFDCKIFACHKYVDPDSCTSSPNNCSFCCDDLGDGIPRCNTYDNLIQAGCRSFDQPEYDEYGEPNSTCPDLPEDKGTCGLEHTLMPNPVDCGSFYQCEPGGNPVLHDCPLGFDRRNRLVSMVFNPQLQVCVHPDDFDCKIFACHKYIDLDSCTSSPNNCSFCCDDLGDAIPRCNTYDNLIQAGCPAFDKSEYDKTSGSSTTCVVLPPGEKRNITVTFHLEKHPLDLYYLMDATGSMADDKENVVSLSSSFLAAVSDLTNDFYVGFGTFKDKPMFASNPNDYSFRNELRLTSQLQNFENRVRDTNIGGGADFPEGCGDALAQVVECYGEIGWRENTRRVILVATDDIFHLNGFGHQFGITAPYVDGCYIDTNGYYTETLKMDFPSIKQLAAAYSRAPVTTTVIFATSWGRDFYEEVASHFENAFVVELAYDSSNIVELIKNEFARIDSKLKIDTSSSTDTVNLKYYSSCMDGDDERETAICENMPDEGKVSFKVEIDLPKCPENGETNIKIDLSPVGLPVFIEVNLSFLCDKK